MQSIEWSIGKNFKLLQRRKRKHFCLTTNECEDIAQSSWMEGLDMTTHWIWMKSNTMIISVGIEHQFHPISSCSVCNWWMRWLGVMFDCPLDSKDTFIRLLNDLFSLCISNNVSSMIFFLHFDLQFIHQSNETSSTTSYCFSWEFMWYFFNAFGWSIMSCQNGRASSSSEQHISFPSDWIVH